MGLFDILKNTVEGSVGAVINIAASPVKVLTDLDGAVKDVRDNINKIGKDY